MNKEELNARIDAWFHAHRAELVEDLKALLRCPSVSDPTSDIKPFGPGCRQAIDTMARLAEKNGFTTENYDYYVLRIGGEKKNWENAVGFWGHLDVVPAGNNWTYAPFDPVEDDGFVIGRGALDNKGAIIGVLYMLRCLRELEIPLNHDFCMFCGCDEERGMSDIDYYRAHYADMPKINIVTDCMFPVCYGEKGILEAQLVSDVPFSTRVKTLAGGMASNMVPDMTDLTVSGILPAENSLPEHILLIPCVEDTLIRGTGSAMHSAFPEKDRPNAIYELARYAAELSALTEEDRRIFCAIADASADYFGVCAGVDYSDEISGPLSSVATTLRLDERCASVGLNIRYSITARTEEILRRLNEFAVPRKFHVDVERISEPSYFSREHPLVDTLTGIFNDVTGMNEKSYILPGGTYARKLPNAFAYGPEIAKTPEEDARMKAKFGPQHDGGAHGSNECVDIEQLLKEMRIYSLCVVAMNDIAL